MKINMELLFTFGNDVWFCNFAKTSKSIWIGYLLSKLILFRQRRHIAANFTQTLWKIRLWEASLRHKTAHCGSRVSKSHSQPLCLIRVSRSSQHRGSHAEKVPIWTTNSCSILIFTFSKKRKIKINFRRQIEAPYWFSTWTKSSVRKSTFWTTNSWSKLKNVFQNYFVK